MHPFRRTTTLTVLTAGLCVYRVACAQTEHSVADSLLAEGHYLRAEQPVRAAVQRNPNDPHALSNLSILEWSFNRLDEAIGAAERAVSVAMNSAEAHAHLADALGSKLIVSTAGTMEKISLAHRFRKEIDKTLELDPNNVDSLEDLAQFYWHAPGLVGGDKNKARQTADKLYQLSPFRGARARADFAMDEGDPNRRAAAIVGVWQTAVAARPNDYDCRAGLAAAYLDQTADPNHLANAEAEAKRAQALDATRIDAYKTLAVVYAKAGRWDEFDGAIKQAKTSVPDDRAPEFAAANAILNDNNGAQLQRAELLLRDYLAQTAEAQEPTHAIAHWRLGQVLERQGRKADAVRELQTAVNQDSSLDGAKKDLKRLS
jgi:tetratricopeptide (TPR) repeat protein